MFTQLYNEAVALLLIRTVAGVLFFFQGYDKIFNVKLINVIRTLSQPLGNLHIPKSWLMPAVALSSFIELSCGLLLFLGLFKNMALYLLAGNLIFVAFVFSSVKAMWEMDHFFPRMVLIVALLLLPQVSDIFSLDYLFVHGLK